MRPKLSINMNVWSKNRSSRKLDGGRAWHRDYLATRRLSAKRESFTRETHTNDLISTTSFTCLIDLQNGDFGGDKSKVLTLSPNLLRSKLNQVVVNYPA